MVIGILHDGFRDERGRAYSFEPSNSSSAFLWPMHTGRIELNYAFGIRQSAIANTVVQRVKFDDVYARDDRVEYVRTLGHHGESFLDRCYVSVMLELVAIG